VIADSTSYNIITGTLPTIRTATVLLWSQGCDDCS